MGRAQALTLLPQQRIYALRLPALVHQPDRTRAQLVVRRSQACVRACQSGLLHCTSCELHLAEVRQTGLHPCGPM